MFREMRRKRQSLSEAEQRAVLARNTAGVLALSGDGGYPYAVPLSYVYEEGKLYFHSAKQGHKLDAILRDARACFTVIDKDEVVPREYTSYFRSVIAFGRVRILADEQEALRALRLLSDKYSPGFEAEREAEIEKGWAALCMLEMTIEHCSGKEAIELVAQKQAERKDG